MVFNVVGRNQDDHTKNIAFLMDKAGNWRLSPAFDLTYSYNPDGQWTSTHQMSINGKRDGFERRDLEACAQVATLSKIKVAHIIDEVSSAFSKWPEIAAEVGIGKKRANTIQSTFRQLKE